MNFIITGKNFVSPIFNQLVGDHRYKILTENQLKNSDIMISNTDFFYVPDESSLPTVLERIKDAKKKHIIESIKNKYLCRKLLSALYPDFFFQSIKTKDIYKLKLPSKGKFIIKPQKGFFGTGVRTIDGKTDMVKLQKDIENEIKVNSDFFSPKVFSQDLMIIEQYLTGNEYTVDMFYDKTGQPVFTNIDAHPQPQHNEYFHLLYYTCKKWFDDYYSQLRQIFIQFNKTLNITSLPIHAEFKETKGKLIPIEFNLPRYGGFGLADLPYHAFGFNPFSAYFNGSQPNWDQIWQKHKDKYYGWVLCYNGKNMDMSLHKPDHERFKKSLPKILYYHQLDYRKNPVFAVAYVEENDEEKLLRLLKTDFCHYFEKIN